MKDKITRNVTSTKSNILAVEVQSLFTNAVSARSLHGVTSSLRGGLVRDIVDENGELPTVETTNNSKEDCGCTEKQSCDQCDSTLPDTCSMQETLQNYKSQSPFNTVANLLTTVKKYEFISLVENAYAQIGNKPFQLKATKSAGINEKEIKKSASAFYEFLTNFLDVNQVRIDEIPDAFNLETLGDVTKALADSAQETSEIRLQESIGRNESVMERIFKRSDFMAKYIEVIKDTTDYPIGILWVDDKALKKERIVIDGKLVFNYSVQSDATRVDPCYFWATQDHKINEPGKAVFKLEQFTSGDIHRWKEHNVSGSLQLNSNVDNYLESNESGFKMNQAMLFRDHYLLQDGLYDVLITRGQYNIEGVKELGVKIPKQYKNEKYIPCEIYFSGSHVLRVRVMECADDRLGVYTTVFRRKGQSIFGYSLHDFIYPFAKLYQGSLNAIDKSMGKSVGSIIQVDTGVIEDPDKYLMKNNETGEITLDLSDDLLIEFDSSKLFNSPNFKGVPIHVTELPSDLNKLLPIVEFIFRQLDKISGIPSILVNSSNISSALRTNSNFNAAFTASAKVVQSLLRESEVRILRPSIKYFFDCKAMSGDMKDFLIEAEPEILLSDTLAREINDDRELLQGVQTLAQFSSLIPQEKLSGLINKVGREVYNLTEDLIPGVGTLSTSSPSTQTQQV